MKHKEKSFLGYNFPLFSPFTLSNFSNHDNKKKNGICIKESEFELMLINRTFIEIS